MQALREASAAVAARATHVQIDADAIPAYARTLKLTLDKPPPDAPADREAQAAFWLAFDAINFGSGWFPTLRRRPGLSGSNTILAALRERGPWTSWELAEIDARTIAAVLNQDPGHELMALFAASLVDLGVHVEARYEGRFAAVADAADGSAVRLATTLGEWASFADTSTYDGIEVPFLKRAQIAAADLHRAGVAAFGDLDRLTMFADNLVPHVLRLDGILRFDPGLTARIEREELIVHGSPEEVEIRACAVHTVELIVAARSGDATAADVDHLLWHRGQERRYKARPRHRCRCTAY